MADSKQLRNRAESLRREMRTKLQEADRATKLAETYARKRNFDRSAKEDEHADRFYSEAMALENEARSLDRQASELDARAAEIDKQEDNIRTSMQAQIEKLEREKKSLRGEY